MRILINYNKSDQAYLSILQFYLQKMGFVGVATPLDLTLSELIQKAQTAKCQGIFLCNATTLANCVPGKSPTLDDYRGSKLDFTVPTIVGNSLSHIHTVKHGAFLCMNDLKKFFTLKARVPAFNLTILEHTASFEEAYQVCSKAVLLAYDIETVTIGEVKDEENDNYQAGETFITCVSWTAVDSFLKYKTYVLPILNFGESHWTSDKDCGQALLLLRRINKLPVPKVMHNGIYDSFHSLRYRAEPINWCLDTMGMAWSQYTELPKSLDFVASLVLPDYVQWKNESEEASNSKDINRYWRYNGLDTFYTARICVHYLQALPAYARKNFAITFKLVYPSLYCSFEGILIDQKIRKESKVAWLKIVDEQLDTCRKLTGNPQFNPGSYVQVGHYIYDLFGATDMRIGKQQATKTKAKGKKERGTDDKNLKAISEQHPILMRIATSIIEYREARKATSTYFNFLQKNGRLYYQIDPFGTDSGRMASSASMMWCGTQIQNFPEYAKYQLMADEGFEFVENDNGKSEAHCVSCLAKELTMREALLKEEDFYKQLGTLMFGIPVAEVTKDFRNKIIKKTNHGVSYVMGASTMIENIGAKNLLEAAPRLGIRITMNKVPAAGEMTLKQFAASLIEAWHKPFPRVREHYKEVINEIATTHMLTSVLGFTRYFFGDIQRNNNIQRSAIAHEPQNLSVGILNIGFWNVYELMKKPENLGKLRLKGQIHDSIPYQRVIGEEGKRIDGEVYQAMQNTVRVGKIDMLIPVDKGVPGTHWYSKD